MSDLSTAEKLTSLNPAARAEGQRELSQQSTSQQQETAKKAVDISRRGYTGTVPLEIVTPKPTAAEEAAQASLIDRGAVAPTVAEEAAQQSLSDRGPKATLHITTPFEAIQGTTPEERKERSTQEIIRQEKAEDLGLTTRDVRVGWELKFRPGTSVIGKAAYESYGRLREEAPGLTRVAESAVMGAATVFTFGRVSPQTVRAVESVIVPAYVIGKATEFKSKPFTPFVIETAQELGGFALGGWAATGRPKLLYEKAKGYIEPKYRYFKYTGKFKPDYDVSIKPNYKWGEVTEKFGIRGKFTPKDVEVIGRPAKEVQLQLYPKRIIKEPIIKTVEKPSFKGPEFQKLRTDIAREQNKWLGQYIGRGALERASLTESQLRLLRSRTREPVKIDYFSGIKQTEQQLKFARGYEPAFDYGKTTTRVIETQYPFKKQDKFKFLIGKKASILAPQRQITPSFEYPTERLLGVPKLKSVEPMVKPIVKFAEQPTMSIVTTKDKLNQLQIQKTTQIQVLSLKQIQQQVQIRTLSQVQIQQQIQHQIQFQVPRQTQRQATKEILKPLLIPKQIQKQIPKQTQIQKQVPKQPKIPKEKIPKIKIPTFYLRPKLKKQITFKTKSIPKFKPVTAYAPTLHAVIGQIKIPTAFKTALKKKKEKKKRMFFTGLEPRGI